jgi:tetratricopeptide (TPR) repeat protein
LHYYQGEYDLAEQDARNALKIIAAKIPKGTSYYAAVYGALGRVFNKTGRSREAEPLLREALAIRKTSPRRNDVGLALGFLGECLVVQKRYAEAEPYLVESYQTLKSVQVPRSPILKEAGERLVSLYAAWGKPSALANYAR